jgi:hypothetical protein
MKFQHNTLAAAAMLIFALNASAETTFSVIAGSQNQKIQSAAAAILKLTVITRHPYVATGDAEFFKSTPTITPCDDFIETSWVKNREITVVSGQTEFDSDDLLDKIGPEATCFRAIYTLNNKNYTTGDIQLVWDDSIQSYIKATPAEVVINFDE